MFLYVWRVSIFISLAYKMGNFCPQTTSLNCCRKRWPESSRPSGRIIRLRQMPPSACGRQKIESWQLSVPGIDSSATDGEPVRRQGIGIHFLPISSHAPVARTRFGPGKSSYGWRQANPPLSEFGDIRSRVCRQVRPPHRRNCWLKDSSRKKTLARKNSLVTQPAGKFCRFSNQTNHACCGNLILADVATAAIVVMRGCHCHAR